jgi:hypothetical protein
MATGQVTLNGIDDSTLALAFKFKAESEGIFSFNPAEMQAAGVKQGKQGVQIYNAMTFRWMSPEGLKAVIELLQKIEHHHSEPKAG